MSKREVLAPARVLNPDGLKADERIVAAHMASLAKLGPFDLAFKDDPIRCRRKYMMQPPLLIEGINRLEACKRLRVGGIAAMVEYEEVS
jgi:hypothetical protein